MLQPTPQLSFIGRQSPPTPLMGADDLLMGVDDSEPWPSPPMDPGTPKAHLSPLDMEL